MSFTRRLGFLARSTALVLAAACRGGENAPSTPSLVAVASVRITPDSGRLRIGDTLGFRAVVRDAQGQAIASQVIAWSSSNAGILSISSAGLATALTAGRANITATAGGQTASVAITVRALSDTLPGDAAAVAATVIPSQRPVTNPTEYVTTNPRLPGLAVSINTLNVVISPTATVGEVNALLRELQAEIIGGVPGRGARGAVLILRLPTTTPAQIEAARAVVRQRPFVRTATTDILLQPLVVPSSNGGTPSDWNWETTATGGNYGLEMIRVPQMWNLNDLVRRNGARTATGVFDAGFEAHNDVVFASDLSGGVKHSHGIHVAGILAAQNSNGRGVDGVTPFANLTVAATASYAGFIWDLASMISAQPDLRVINVSLGYNWSKHTPATFTDETEAARDQAADDGETLVSVLDGVESSGAVLPVIVSASGNDSRIKLQEAKWASPFNAAGIIHRHRAFIVVESIDSTGARAASSNVNGDVSAPGVNIRSAGDPTTTCGAASTASNAYQLCSGTSMASPHVAGLVSYLFSLTPALPAPTATTNRVRDLILANTGTTTGGASARVDAFATVMDVDRSLSNDRVLRGLLDIDDGSVDGNLRLNAAGAPETSDDLDGDFHLGDGRIDMSDFRRFRDWLLDAEGIPGLALNGPGMSLKRDLNRDSIVGTRVLENVYPRADFNGDGILDRTSRRQMRGALAGQNFTDLEVLQSKFSDEDYVVGQLPLLLTSGDVTLTLDQCAALPGTVSLRITARLISQSLIVQQRTVPSSRPFQMLTLPSSLSGYAITVDALDAAGSTTATAVDTLPVNPGGDAFFTRQCQSILNLEGKWSGEFTSTVTSPGQGTRALTAFSEISLSQAASGVTGNYLELNPFKRQRGGSIRAAVVGTQLLNLSMYRCLGELLGAATIAADGRSMRVTYAGSDCDGTHTNGTATLTRGAGIPALGGIWRSTSFTAQPIGGSMTDRAFTSWTKITQVGTSVTLRIGYFHNNGPVCFGPAAGTVAGNSARGSEFTLLNGVLSLAGALLQQVTALLEPNQDPSEGSFYFDRFAPNSSAFPPACL